MAVNGAVNTVIYKEDWAEVLQQELDEANKFEDICRVEYTDQYLLHNPYLTDASVHVIAQGTPYTFEAVVRTDESVTINQRYAIPQFIDRADLAQSGYMKQMELAQRQGVVLKEQIESAVFANHGNMTNFGAGDITGGSVADTTQITVSLTNIDDIITHLIRVIRVANGESLFNRNGGFIVWRPADFQLLTSFMMANGFNSADLALRKGAQQGVEYMGLTHYSSNLLAANHIIAGVKKVIHLGILSTTYGQIMVDDKDPNLQSGISIVSRIDYQTKVWNKTKPVVFDVNCA